MAWKMMEKSRRLVADEVNLFPPSAGGDVRVALCYPNTYFVGMSNLGFQSIYGLLNREAGVVCERCFLPDAEDIPAFRQETGALFTLESQTRLQECDIVGFSVSYELDFPNLLRILLLAGIPLRSADRDASWPLVIAGGAISFLNPEPLADFIDAFVVGEGEAAVRSIVEVYRAAGRDDRATLLRALACIPGVYVPSLYDCTYDGVRLVSRTPRSGAPPVVPRQVISPLDFPTHTSIITPHTEFSRSFLVEVSRGCPYLCRFCVVGYVYTPNRWRDLELLRQVCDVGLRHTDRVGLMGAVVNLYPKMPELTRYLLDRGARCSFASLRADSLSDAVVDAIQASGQETLTLAPETGDVDLRWFIHKKMKDEALLRAVEKGVERGVRNFRLYFMLGIPGETPANLDATIAIIAEVHRMVRERARAGSTLSVSVSQFVPKAGTPFQWMPLAPAEAVEAGMKRIADRFRKAPGLKVHTESPRWCRIQGLLARGDRRLGRVLERLEWSDSNSAWSKAMRAEGLNMDACLYGPRDPETPMPWDVVQAPELRGRLQAELDKARTLAGRKTETPPHA